MNKHVRIYIEGGSQGRIEDSNFRRGWKKFLQDLHILSQQNGYQSLIPVRSKSRADAFRRFCRSKRDYPSDLCVLLVDSEMVLSADAKVWDVVAQREGDKWQRPNWATEQHLFLMVAFVETWLLTDQQALASFFKRGFNTSQLPTTDLENRSKADIEKALKQATKNCKNGPYRHGQAHEIIEFVRPIKVKSLIHGGRLFDELSSLISSKTKI